MSALLCPMTMARTPANPEPCVGDACAAWRGKVPARGHVFVHSATGGVIEVSKSSAEHFRWQQVSVAEGHCGLAGPLAQAGRAA